MWKRMEVHAQEAYGRKSTGRGYVKSTKFCLFNLENLPSSNAIFITPSYPSPPSTTLHTPLTKLSILQVPDLQGSRFQVWKTIQVLWVN
jgi:hypothetical protein